MPNKKMQLIINRLGDAPRNLDDALLKNLAKTARPFAPLVRANILNIKVKGLKPYGQPPGLRLRIARCVVPFATSRGRVVTVGLYMDVRKMPSGQYSLPLGMEGVKSWRHPLFGDRAKWFAQGGAPQPYFYTALTPLGPASEKAIGRALDEITRQISGDG